MHPLASAARAPSLPCFGGPRPLMCYIGSNRAACARLDCWEAANWRAWSDLDDSCPCVSPHAVLPLRVPISAHVEAAGGRDLLRCAHTQLIRCKTDKKLTRSRCWREKFSSVNMSLFVSYLLSGTVCGVLSTQARPGGEFELFRASALDRPYPRRVARRPGTRAQHSRQTVNRAPIHVPIGCFKC